MIDGFYGNPGSAAPRCELANPGAKPAPGGCLCHEDFVAGERRAGGVTLGKERKGGGKEEKEEEEDAERKRQGGREKKTPRSVYTS